MAFSNVLYDLVSKIRLFVNNILKMAASVRKFIILNFVKASFFPQEFYEKVNVYKTYNIDILRISCGVSCGKMGRT